MMIDAARQEKIYIEYHSKVLGYIISRIKNRSDAEDLASTVFLKVFKNLPHFDERKSSISTWIYTITRNTLIDYFKGMRIVLPLSEIEASSDDVERDILRDELLETLASALEGMDERERDLIVLHYYREKTLTEIASLMNISYSYVKVLHKKAIEDLKTVFNGVN